MDQLSNVKDIKSWQKKSFGEKIRPYFQEAWYFEKAWEKVIMVGLSILGMAKIYGWIF